MSASRETWTIRSEVVKFTPVEAKAIVSCWKRDFQRKEHDGPVLPESQIEIPANLNGLIDRLSSSTSSLSPEKGAFIKLSTRSPKDSLVAFDKARKAYQSCVGSLGENPQVNDKLHLLSTKVGESLLVKNGKEAINLLISSDRVGEDLEYALEKSDEDFTKSICLVLQEWVDIPQWAEFRGFVSKGKMTAIGRYNFFVRSPHLKEKVTRIRDDLNSFHTWYLHQGSYQRRPIHHWLRLDGGEGLPYRDQPFQWGANVLYHYRTVGLGDWPQANGRWPRPTWAKNPWTRYRSKHSGSKMEGCHIALSWRNTMS